MPSNFVINRVQVFAVQLAGFRRTWSVAACADIGIFILCILPLSLTAHVPLTDLPNHLARQYIIRDLPSSPILQQYYAVHWALEPNLALEIFVMTARQVMSIDMAIRVFCIVILLLLCIGTRLTNRTFSGKTSRAYRAVPLLCYGGPFQYGFLSYSFGIGLGITLFGTFLHLRARSWPIRVMFLSLSGFALLLCHLEAFGLFAVAIGVCELNDNAPNLISSLQRPVNALGRVSVPITCFILVFLLFILLSPTANTASAHDIHFGDMHERLRGLLSITFFTKPRLETGLLLLAVSGLVGALATRAVKFHPTGLAICIAMTIVWLLTPNVAIGGAYIAYRIPWAISFFVLAALLPGAYHQSWAMTFGALFGVLVSARLAIIAVLWLRWEPTLNAIDQALSDLPVGARLMVVEGTWVPGTAFRDPDLANVSSYAVARRQAFDPAMFASMPGQILAFQPHYRPLWGLGGFSGGNPSKLTSLAPDYQYLLVLRPELATIGPDIPLSCQAHGPQFFLFKVVQPAQSQGFNSCDTKGP